MYENSLNIDDMDITNKLSKIFIVNVIQTCVIVIFGFTLLIFYTSNNHQQTPSKVLSYSPDPLGIGFAQFLGLIDTKYPETTYYMFQYTIKEFIDPNNTRKNTLDVNSKNFSQFVGYLLPDTEYEFRTIAIVGEDMYPSEFITFKTGAKPLFEYISSKNLNNTNLNNVTVVFYGKILNTGSSNIKYSGQIRWIGSPNWITLQKYPLIKQNDWVNVSITTTGISEGNPFVFRFIAVEDGYDNLFHGDSHYINTLKLC